MAGDKTVRFRLFGSDVTASKTLRNLGNQADRTSKKIGGIAKGAALVGGLTAGLASTTASALSAGAALATLSGSALLLPAAGLAAGAGAAAVAVGVMGISDAFKNSADPEKYAESLKTLAPAARSVVREIMGMKPAADAARIDVQQALFEGLGQTAVRLGRTYLPIARNGLRDLAATFNATAKVTARELLSKRTGTDIKAIFRDTAAGARNLVGVGASAVAIVRDIGVVGARFLPGLTSGFAGAASRAAAFVSSARASGDIARWIQDGLDALRQLGQAAGNIAGTVSGLWRAASEGSGGFLNVLVRITGAISALVNSAEGQAGLRALFSGVSAGVGSITTALAGAGPLLAQLGPLIGELARQFGSVLGAAFTAVLPTLTALAPILTSMLQAVGPFLTQNAGALTVFVAGLGAMALAVKAVTVATAAWQAVSLLASAATKVWAAGQWLLNAALTANPIGLVIAAIAALVAGIIYAYNNCETFRNIVQAAMRGAVIAFNWTLNAVMKIVGWIRGNWPSLLAILTGPIGMATKFILDNAGKIILIFQGIPGKIVGFFAGLPGQFASIGSNIIDSMRNAVLGKAGELAGAVRDAVGNAVSAAKGVLGISSPSKVFAQIGKDVGRGFVKGIRGERDDVLRVMGKLMEDVAKISKKRLRQSLGRLVGKRRVSLARYAGQRDVVRERLKEARQGLAELRQSAAQERSSVRDAVLGTGSVAADGDDSYGSIIARLQNAVARAKAFARLVERLRKGGLGPVALQQLIDAGPEAGMQAAEAIARQGSAGIKEVNRLQSELGRAGGSLGQTSAKSLYLAGIRAAEGLVRGLKARERELTMVMDRLAKSMVAAIKKALKIKSPSRVFEGLGVFTGRGLVRGLESQQRPVSAAAADLLARATARPYGLSAAPLGPVGAMHGGTTVVVQMSGSFVGSEQQLARQLRSVLTTASARGVS